MFNNSKPKVADTPVGSTTIIGAGTVIRGNVSSDGDIRIDGTLIGNLDAKAKVLVGADGVVEGDIKGLDADILGKVTGQLKINELLQLRGRSNVSGEIFAGKLEVEPTATFNGNCHMGANVVELNSEMGNVVNK
ncbi:MAG TPA: polymer-forming cytoskeletal protein [Ferruginibacter sp.]|nr:polymer-forming cytoskeletal protein [Ferruginibacter sp.]HMP20110.1 polymer-forming cytoskeletal protein [Ferruginibacter sp.]